MHDERAEITLPAGQSRIGLLGSRPALWTLVLFYAAYVAAGTFSSGLAVIPGIAVIFWPPVGILIATLLLNQRESWPWWVVAGCAAELTANSFLWHNPLPYAFLYYSGNALEALTAAYLISRFAPKPFRFETIEQVLSFVFLAAGIAPTVSATIISAVDAFRGRHAFTTGWPLVWVGDATGLLISAPLTFVAVQAWRERNNIPQARLLEAGAALILMLGIAALALTGPVPTIYLTLPVLLWIAMRFRLKGTAVALGLLTLTTGSFTVAGLGQFATPSPAEHFNLLRFHVFLAVSAISALFVAALSQQRLNVLADLETANRDLERRVADRTGDLLESENRLRLAAEAAATGIWEWDLSGDRVEWTDRVFEIVGVDREDFDGTNASFINSIHPDDRESVLAAVSSAIEGDTAAECEFRIVRPDGEIRWVHDRGRVTSDARGRRLVGTITDITERKTLEFQSRRQFEELESIYQAAPVGMAVIDRDFRFVRVNEWLAKNNGVPADEHVGRSVREVVPALADQAEAILRKVIDSGEAVRGVVIEGDTAAQPDVHRAWSEIWHPIKNDRGETIAVNVVIEDVTESKWGEQVLIEQNRLLELIAAGKPLDHILTELTAVIARLEPQTRAAVLVADPERSRFESAFAAHIPSTYTSNIIGAAIEEHSIGTCGDAVFHGVSVTCTDIASDGRWDASWRDLSLRHGIVACHSEPVIGENAQPIASLVLAFGSKREPDERGLRVAAFGTQVASIAIERSRAEQALAASEDKYRVLFDSMDQGYCIIEVIFDDDGRPIDYLFVEVNSAFERQAGMNDVVGKRMLEFVPAIESHWLDNYGSVARSGIPIRFANEYKGLNKWFDVYAFRPEGWEGSRIAVLFTDITVRKLVEGEIAAAAARDEYRIHLADTIRGLPDPEDVKREAARLLGERLGVNRAYFAEVRGDDWVVAKGFESGVEHMPDGAYSAEEFGHWIMDTYRRGERFVLRDTRSDPRLSPAERDAHVSANILSAVGVPLLKGGGLVAVLALNSTVARDWSDDELALLDETAERTWEAVEMVRAEEALRSAHDTFRRLVDDSPFGIYVVDADFKLARVSAGAQKVFENVNPLIGRDFADVLRVVWEEPFATEAIDIFRRTLETGKPYHSPRTIETRGDISEIESYDWRTERITMPDGRYGVVCHFYDLSERLRYEADLREAEERFRSTFEQAAVGIAHVSPDGHWLLVNERLCEITGYSRSELTELTFQQITHPDDLVDDLSYLQRILDGELDHYAMIKRYLRRDGGLIWVNLTVSLVREADGAPKYFISVVEDITERKRAEDALMTSEELLASTFSGVEAAIAISKVINGGDDFRVLSVNRACVDRTGIPFESWKGSRFRDILPAEAADAITERYREAVRNGSPVEYEEKLTLPIGDIWALTTVTPLRDQNGDVTRVVATSIDISKRKAAEQALRESETRQRLALKAGGMGTWTMPLDGRRGWADERTLALFDVPADEWTGDIASLHSRRFPQDVEANSRTATDADGGTMWRSEFRVQHRDGSIRWLAGVARIEYDQDGSPRMMRGIYFDVTERKQAEEELRRHREFLEETVRERTAELAAAVSSLQYENRQRRIVEEERQLLLARLVAAQEEERRRIAQDLHDQLGQQLTALNMKLDLALRSAAAGDGTGHLSEARAMLRRIDDDVDALAWELRPAMLDDDGFLPALRRYVEDWSGRYRVRAEFWADDEMDAPGFLSSEAETNLYRITQEALNNIAKYAGASSVEVLLKRRGDVVVLLIQDNGAGFDVAGFGSKKLKTMGLVGMRERAGLVGGTFQIESAPGEGTTVYVKVPLASAESSASEFIRSAGS